MFFTSIIPWTGNFVYQSGLAPYRIDIVPFTFFLVGPLFALAIFRFKMFDFVPIARHVVFDFMYDPVLVVDATGRLADYNRAAETILPGLSSQMIGNELRQILQDHPNLEDYLLPPYRAREEIRLGKGTSSLVFQLSVIPIIGTQQREEAYVLMMHDISQQKLLLDTFQEQARMDALTGIYNRRYFMELGLKSLQHMSRYGHAFSLGILDLDHFKSINDEHGHLVGDDVLRAAAQLFAEVLREEDILGRYGGEEFIFFLPETSPKVAMTVAERLRCALARMEISSKEQPIHITASFGITGYDQATPGLSMKEMCKKADEALYLAKNKGRNRVEMLV
jgi:diguanylate cyclase (GGDEF)-like protein